MIWAGCSNIKRSSLAISLTTARTRLALDCLRGTLPIIECCGMPVNSGSPSPGFVCMSGKIVGMASMIQTIANTPGLSFF